ncbi:MAG: hypothetical protein IJI68_10670 [Eggerthellaceae bacterium]|nr:hypothetical protein [Eggerthellaceae bacterium]
MKRRIATATLCAMICIALSGFAGCTPPPDNNEQAQAAETLTIETLTQSQAIVETIGREAIELAEVEEANVPSTLGGQSGEAANSAEAAGNSNADAGVSRAPGIGDFTVKGLTIEEDNRGEGDAYTARYRYIISGTLVNNSAADANRVAFDLQVTQHYADGYGDDDPHEGIVGGTVGLTPGIVGNSSYYGNNMLFNMKAGEARAFSLAFGSDVPCTDPTLQVLDADSEVDPGNDDTMFGYDEFDVTFGSDRCTAIKSSVDARIDQGVLYFSYIDSHGNWCEERAFVSGVWPNETYEVVNNLGFADEENNFTFLGMTYAIDEDRTGSSFREEFDVNYDRGSHVLKITNNSGHYLLSMHVFGSATYHTETKGEYRGEADFVAPGDTVEFSPDGSPDDINIFDIFYRIDDSKEGKVAD